MTKKPFSGFPARAEVTPIPNLFFATVMPQVDDIAELKTILHVFWLLSRRRGYPRFVTYSQLLSYLCSARHALHLAVQHGTMLHLRLDRDGETEDAYFINTEAGKSTIDEIQQGKLALPGLRPKEEARAEAVLPPDIFTLYEQNIGMLTPMIGEELQEAEKLYPADWIESAFREAVSVNKRSWKYIARILERWAVEGKDDGKLRRS